MVKNMIAGRLFSGIHSSLLSLAAGSAMLFVVLVAFLHVAEPEFDPTWRFISEYQLGNYGWMMHLAFIALSTSLAATGMALWSQAKGWMGRIGTIGLWIAAAGLLIAGIFTTDPIGTAQNAMTFGGSMHVFGASLDYSPLAFVLLSLSLRRDVRWNPIWKYLLAAALVTLVLMFAFIFALPKDGVFDAGVRAGLIGRLLLVSYAGWILVAYWHSRKLVRKS